MKYGYPWLGGDRVTASGLDIAFELSGGASPPVAADTLGAGRFKQWMDTSTNPPTLRICTAVRASAAYNPNDWATLGTLDLAGNKFNFQIGDVVTSGNISASGSVTATSLHWHDTTTPSQTWQISAHDGVSYITTDIANGWGIAIGYSDYNVTTNKNCTVGVNGGNLTVNGVGHITGVGGLFVIDGHDNTDALVVKRSDLNAYFSMRPEVAANTGLFSYYSTTGSGNLQISGLVTCLNGLHVNGAPLAYGPSAGYYFIDQTTGRQWAWYGAGDYVWLHNSTSTVCQIRQDGQFTANGVVSTGAVNAVTYNFNDSANNNPWKMWAHDGVAYIETSKSNGWCLSFSWNDYTVVANANFGVNGGLVVQGGGTAIWTPNGNIVGSHQIIAGNDVVANGVFRQHDLDTGGNKGARIECFGGDNGWLTFAMSGGYFQVSPDLGTSGWNFQPVGTFSDARLKADIRDSEVDALAAIQATPLRAFTWTPLAHALMPHRDGEVPCGLVAQELAETIPFAVDTLPMSGDILHVHDEYLIPYIFRAIQQIADRLDAGGL